MKQKALFLDRDGTLIIEPDDEVVDSIEKVELFPETLSALQTLSKKDYLIFLITNQIGIGQGRLDIKKFETINAEVLRQIQPTGIKIEKTYYCPHLPQDNCICRKPKTGLIDQAQVDYEIDIKNSFVIGDRETDVLLGKNIGAKTILINRSGSNVKTEADYIASDLNKAFSFI